MNQSLLTGLSSGRIEQIVLIRVRKNVDLLSAIEEAVESKNIKKGLILGGIGALKRAVFRNMKKFPENLPVENSDRLYLEINKPLELLSLTGHISERENGLLHIHAHFSASFVENNRIITLGGHLTRGSITFIKVTAIIAVLQEINMHSKYCNSSKSIELIVDD